MHKNSTRQLPLSFECPSQLRACVGGDVDVAMSSEGEDIDYVVLTAAAFSAHNCFWIGDVRDAYVGVCKGDSLEYRVLSSPVRKRKMVYSHSLEAIKRTIKCHQLSTRRHEQAV
jgi:hypothetical protein